MAVPLLDLKRQYQPLREEIRAALDRVCDEQRFILGPEVEVFEAEAAAALSTGGAVGVSSGTDALLIALMALGIGKDDEVILPVFTFFATAGVVARLGARPVFVDIDPMDYCLDVAGVVGQMNPCTRAILPVHLFGQAADMEGLVEVAEEIPVVEDCAQAWGATHAGRGVGGIGAMGAFSFFPSKNLGGFGDGGLVTSNDPELVELLRQLRVHGQSGVYQHAHVGGNFRLDALQAAVLRIKMRHVEAWVEARRRNAARYAELFALAGLDAILSLPRAVEGRGHTYNQYVVRAPKRDELKKYLAGRGIGAAVYYPLPLHLQPCCQHLGYREGAFPVAERASREVLALPVFPEMTPAEQEEVVEGIAAFYGR